MDSNDAGPNVWASIILSIASNVLNHACLTLLRAANQLMFLHGVEYRLDTVYDRAIFEAFFARENFSDFLEVSFFLRRYMISFTLS